MSGTSKNDYCMALPVVSKPISEAKKGGGAGAGLKEMMLQASKAAGGSLGAQVQVVSASSEEGVFKPPVATSAAPVYEAEDQDEAGIVEDLRTESEQLWRVYSSFVGEEDGDDLPPKTLLALAEEPEFNEEICRLAKWQRQGISAADMAGRRKVRAPPSVCVCALRGELVVRVR